MKRKKLFKNYTDYLVLAFIVGLLGTLAYCEDADAGEFSIEEAHDSTAGTSDFNRGLDRICARYTFNTGTSFAVCPLVAVGGTPKHDSFEIGLADELWPRWEGQVTLNRYDGVMDGGFSIRRMIGDGPFKFYLGGSYWMNESPGSSSNFTFNLGMRYTF